MKVCAVGAEVFYVDRRTDRQTDRQADRQGDRQTDRHDNPNSCSSVNVPKNNIPSSKETNPLK